MTGYHTGAVITSLLALQVTDNWQVLFYVLGIAGLVIAAVQWFRLPESEAFVRAKEARPARRIRRTPTVDAVSFGEATVADEGSGHADEGEEVFGLALITALETTASGQPGDRSLDDPAVSAEPF